LIQYIACSDIHTSKIIWEFFVKMTKNAAVGWQHKKNAGRERAKIEHLHLLILA